MTKNKNTPKLRFPEFSEEWKNGIIGDISDNIMAGATPSTSVQEFWKNGSIPWLSSGEVNKRIIFETNNFITKKGFDSSSTKMVPKNSVLIGLAGQGKTRGTVAINKIELCTNQSIASIIVNNKAHYKFIFYALFKKYGELRVLSSSGSGRGGLNLKLVKSFKIKFSSFEEQEKIAIFLSKVDEKISLLEDKLNYFEDFKKFCMQQLFARKLRFKNAKGENYPDWEEKRLCDIGSIITGNTPPTKNINNYMGGKYLWVTPTDINNSKVINKTERLLSDEGLKNGRKIPENSLLVTCIASIGKNCIIKEKCSCNQQINAITPYKGTDLDFLYYLIEKNNAKLKQYAGITATPILNKTSFEKLNFLFPEFNEQQILSKFLTSIDEKIEKLNFELENIKKFKKGLLQQMLI